jgi:CRP-like cAMP-binding protein
VSTTNPALEQFIRGIPLFRFVGSEDIGEVLGLLRPVELKSGDVLFREGEPGRAMWVLTDQAEVTISSTSGQGKPVVVAYAKKGDVLGEMALVDDGPRSGTAIVTQEGHAHQIDAQAFHAMRDTFVPAAFKVLRKIALDLCIRLRMTNERIVTSSASALQSPELPGSGHPEPADLDAFPAFRTLPKLVKLALSKQLEVVMLEGLTPIFGEGEPGDSAYFIVDGEVTVGRNGKTLANLPAGTMFGIVACIDEGVRSASCVSTGPAKLFRMRRRDFDQLFDSGHRFAFQLVDLITRQLVQHVRDANTMIPRPGKAAGQAKTGKALPTALPSEATPGDLDLIPLELELDIEAPTA